MRRKIINCNHNCENILFLFAVSSSRPFLDTRKTLFSQHFKRFSSFPSHSLLPSINKWKHVCFHLPKTFFSRRKERKTRWRWRRRKRVAKRAAFARIFRNASERNFREIFLEFFFVRLQSATFGNDQEAEASLWSLRYNATVVSVVVEWNSCSPWQRFFASSASGGKLMRRSSRIFTKLFVGT